MIFLGLCDICGYYSELERGFLQRGIPCTLVNAYPDRSYARSTRPGWIGRIVEALAVRRVAAERGSVSRKIYTVVQAVAMYWLMVWSLFTCRVYVFAGGTSFFPPYDLWVLRAFGKRVILIFHGSDARPPYINGAVPCESPADVDSCIAEAARMKQRLKRIEPHVDVIVNHVLSSQFHERPIVKWLEIGIPMTMSRPAAKRDRGDTCMIVHAPTRPGPKGSSLIEAAIVNLQRRGYAIDFVKLVGRPPSEVLERLYECDFVVDELFSDTTMASFAAEAASFGKAAIVGLHGYDVLSSQTAAALLPPAVVCRAADVESAIETLLLDRDLRERLGSEARQFLERQWNSAAVAERFMQLIDDRIPGSWYFDPRSVHYVQGWGLSDAQASARVRAVIDRGGLSALQLDDKPELRQAFLDLAGRSEC
jgi:glycosyltransferase involved in cell wall biosynthesis